MTELMFTMRPEPRAIMCSSSAFVIANAPNRLTFSTLCQSSGVILRTVLSTVMPALLTRKSIRPHFASTSATTRSQSSVESTRPWCTDTCAPWPSSRFRSASAVSWPLL